jgi:hypothetical protein
MRRPGNRSMLEIISWNSSSEMRSRLVEYIGVLSLTLRLPPSP